MGKIAIGLHYLPQWYHDKNGEKVKDHHQAEEEDVSDVLDELHLRKIDIADTVYIVNPNGYIGDRTAFEIEHAEKQGKTIIYYDACKTGGFHGQAIRRPDHE